MKNKYTPIKKKRIAQIPVSCFVLALLLGISFNTVPVLKDQPL